MARRGRQGRRKAPPGDPVPQRCNGAARADAPTRHGGPHRTRWGLDQNTRQAAAARTLPGPRGVGRSPAWSGLNRGATKRAAPGCIPGVLREGAAARVRRAETGLAANVGDDAPQPPPLGRQRKWRRGLYAACLRLRGSRYEADGSPIKTELTTPAPPADAAAGRGCIPRLPQSDSGDRLLALARTAHSWRLKSRTSWALVERKSFSMVL